MNIFIIFLISARIFLINENFDGNWGPYGDNPPTGWTIIDNGNENPAQWNENDWHKYEYPAGSGNFVARVYWSPIEQQEEWLISPSFDLSSASACSLYFWLNYQDYSTDNTDTGYVLLSLDGGTTWTETLFVFVDIDCTDKDTFYDLTPYAGNANCKIAFLYKGDNDLYWYIDSVKVIKQQALSDDVGISTITTPSQTILNRTIQIQVNVKNYGTNNQTNVPVRCKVIKERTGTVLFNQLKTISNLPAGAESTVTFNYTASSPGNLIIRDSTELVGDQNTQNDKKESNLMVIKVVTPPWSDNFDADSSLDLWTHNGVNDEWQIGRPVNRGPSSAYSPPKCVATDTAGLYENSSDNYLYTPYFDLTSFIASDSVFIYLYHFDSLETNYDYVYVEIKRKGDLNWSQLDTFNGYLTNWQKDSVLILNTFYGDTVQIRFHFTSDGSVQKAGFYMDDFSINSKFGTPVINPMEFDDGNYQVKWSKVNKADYYVLYRATGSKVFEDLCNSTTNWNISYFILTEDNAFSESYSFWSGEFERTSPNGGVARSVDAWVSTKNNYWIQSGGAYVEFYAKWEIGSDIIYLEYSNDGGNTWTSVWSPDTNIQSKWKKINVLISTSGWTKFRFHYIGDDTLNPGFYFDNFKVYSLSAFSAVDTTTDTFYTFTNEPDGIYFYKVKAFTNNGMESKFSNTENIIIKNSSNTPPSITLISPSVNTNADGYLFIKFNANDVDDSALIAVYYDNNQGGYNGTEYTKWILEKGGIDSIRIDVRNIPLNNFYIYLMITDITDSAYSGYSGRITKTSLIAPAEVPANGTDTVYNNYVRLIHQDDETDGTIGHISTILGDTAVTSDDSINILFGTSFDPWSSDAVIRVDGKSYIFAKPGEGVRIRPLTRLIGDQGIPTTQPSNPSMPDNSVGLSQGWWYDGIEVYQDMIFAYGKFSWAPDYYDQLLCKFVLKNVSNSPKSVALKIEWDLEIESEDGAITQPSGDPLIFVEWRYTSDVMREYFICQDSTQGDTLPPLARTAGYIKNWGVATPPDEFLIVNWRHLNSYPGITYRVMTDDSLDWDSALDLIWYPRVIQPGDSLVYYTYYGSTRYDIYDQLGYFEELLTAQYKQPFVILKWKIKDKYRKVEIFRQKKGALSEKIGEIDKEIEEYKDIPDSPGEYLYKIKFTLLDGKIKELGPVKVKVKRFPLMAKLSRNILKKGNLTMNVSIPHKGTLTLNIIDISGRRILKKDIKLNYPGWYNISTPNKLKSGTYFVNISFNGEEIHKEKIVVVK